MFRNFVSAASVVALTGIAARGETVQFRIVQLSASTSQALGSPNGYAPGVMVQDYAVQAQVTGGAALNRYAFTLAMPGEPDVFGTLQKGLISNSDGTYHTGATAVNSNVGVGGLPLQYSNLAAFTPSLNGLINTSGGTFTNTPEQQEIGTITGLTGANQLEQTPGLSLPPSPPNGTTAALPPAVGQAYFAQGSWVDVYRFRYTISNTSNRTLTFTLQGVTATTFTQFVYMNPNWQGQSPVFANVTVMQLLVPVGNANGACCVGGAGDGLCTLVPQAFCLSGGGNWAGSGTCAPSPCSQLGMCCQLVGTCSITLAGACAGTGVWTQSGTCAAVGCNVRGACCHGATCTLALSGACAAPNVYIGDGHACSPLGRSGFINACCAADFNNSAGLAVDDIFGFLNAWFAGCP